MIPSAAGKGIIMNMEKYDIIIIGLGPAGAAAAIYSSRAGLSSVVLEGNVPGGQVSLTDRIDNYPGVAEIEGWELASRLASQAEACGARIVYEPAVKVELDKKLVSTADKSFSADAIIIAGGARHRRLGLDGEERLTGRGISYCAVCDGRFYKGRTVAVVGGGETAVGDAIYLSRLCEKVYLIHRRGELRASRSKQAQLANLGNVELLLDSRVSSIGAVTSESGERLESVTLDSGRVLKLDGLFVAIGSIPDTSLYTGLTLDDGYIVTDDDMATGIPGVFAAGDIRKKKVRQIITAASDGAVAAISAAEYLENKGIT